MVMGKSTMKVTLRFLIQGAVNGNSKVVLFVAGGSQEWAFVTEDIRGWPLMRALSVHELSTPIARGKVPCFSQVIYNTLYYKVQDLYPQVF